MEHVLRDNKQIPIVLPKVYFCVRAAVTSQGSLNLNTSRALSRCSACILSFSNSLDNIATTFRRPNSADFTAQVRLDGVNYPDQAIEDHAQAIMVTAAGLDMFKGYGLQYASPSINPTTWNGQTAEGSYILRIDMQKNSDHLFTGQDLRNGGLCTAILRNCVADECWVCLEHTAIVEVGAQGATVYS